MAQDPTWNGQPAVGTILARMVELYTRALRVDLERRRQNTERLAKMVAK
jgi:hypothetical protein